jgi:GT2 family glycosyltransferase
MNTKAQPKHPFVSVVVVTYNRGDIINSCLKSLKVQDYPKDRYEIIVVDDGSSDNTVKLAHAQGVKVIQHYANKGIPFARNTGLAAASGELIAYIDDDAVADTKWLEYLVQPFSSPDVVASGGRTYAYKTNRFSERYLEAVGYGNPAPLDFGKSKNPFWRFLVYIKGMFSLVTNATIPTEVQAVFGLNCAFRTSALREIGGFDETLKADEDSEISTRLRQTGARIIFVPKALIRHRHRESLIQLLSQTYRRAEYTVHYYAKEKKILPMFPFPLFYIVVAAVTSVLWPVIGVIFIILAPVILYGWWVIRGVRENHHEYFIYGYVQLLLELAAVLGMVRGVTRRSLKLE